MAASQLSAAALLLASASGSQPADVPMVHLECGSQLCKAETRIEGGERVLYLEASAETQDVQNETILAQALEESKDYFLRFGRIDLDHSTVWGMIRETKLDPSHPYAREIGRPLDVRFTRRPGDVPRVWVKCSIFSSPDPANKAATAANWFWDTLQLNPPMVWYPSVAGSLLPGGRTQRADGSRVIHKLRWHSIGLSRNPVNNNLGPASTVPLEVFCKAMREGFDVSGVLAALSGRSGAPGPADADDALRRSGIMVPPAHGGSVAPGLLTTERANLIRQSILASKDFTPPYDLGLWLRSLAEAGVTPQEGMAYVLAILDQHNGLNPA